MSDFPQPTRRRFLGTASTFVVCAAGGLAAAPPEPAVVLETPALRYTVDAAGRVREVSDRRTGRNYLAASNLPAANCFLSLKKRGVRHLPTRCGQVGDLIRTEFADASVVVECRAVPRSHYLTLEVVSVEGEGVEEIALCQLALSLTDHVGSMAGCAWNDEFAMAVLALDLRVNAGAQRGSAALLWSTAYARLGWREARVALMGCPSAALRPRIQELVLQERLPHSLVGGAWALDAPETRYSYLFSYAGESDADAWIQLARQAGMRELLLSEIGPYGHYNPYPARFPSGLAGVREVVAKIHAAGMLAGWHMLAFTIQKTDPWVTPVPDHRLAVRSTLTLAEGISAAAPEVPTQESPENLPQHSGFWFRGGRDILVDDEILTYSGFSTQPPWRLTGCQRGAYGTRPAAHAAGAKLHNLQEVFGTYLPAPDSSLLKAMEERIASILNYCRFDKIYMDGLDGADGFAGAEWAWHHGAKFALSVMGQARHRVQFEASAWFHHDWHVTSCLGAWDYARRDPKRFVDLHIAANRDLNNLLPTQLGWWAFTRYQGRESSATTLEDIAYLGAKCLGNDMALSLEEIAPKDLAQNPSWPALLATLQEYERQRLTGAVSEAAKARLRQPGVNFALRRGAAGAVEFEPRVEQSFRLDLAAGAPARVRLNHQGAAQIPRLRLQALLSPASAEDPGAVLLEDFRQTEPFRLRAAAAGVRGDLQPAHFAEHGAGVVFSAESRRRQRRGAWLRAGRAFVPARNLSAAPALGVWVRGDGKGEVLNLQLVDVRGSAVAIGEHYVVVDFTGWRYVAMLESAARRWSDYLWPYDNPMAVYREFVDVAQISELNLYFNELPPADTVTCALSAIQALPAMPARLVRPRLSSRGRTVEIPVEIASGGYVEIDASGACRLYNENGVALSTASLTGQLPPLLPGENDLFLTCDVQGATLGCAELTVISVGAPFPTQA